MVVGIGTVGMGPNLVYGAMLPHTIIPTIPEPGKLLELPEFQPKVSGVRGLDVQILPSPEVEMSKAALKTPPAIPCRLRVGAHGNFLGPDFVYIHREPDVLFTRGDMVRYDTTRGLYVMMSGAGEGVIDTSPARRPDAALIVSGEKFLKLTFSNHYYRELGVRIKVKQAPFKFEDIPDFFDVFLGFEHGLFKIRWEIWAYRVYLDPKDHQSAPADVAGIYEPGFFSASPIRQMPRTGEVPAQEGGPN